MMRKRRAPAPAAVRTGSSSRRRRPLRSRGNRCPHLIDLVIVAAETAELNDVDKDHVEAIEQHREYAAGQILAKDDQRDEQRRAMTISAPVLTEEYLVAWLGFPHGGTW